MIELSLTYGRPKSIDVSAAAFWVGVGSTIGNESIAACQLAAEKVADGDSDTTPLSEE
jgi:hypothetical protein